MSNPSPAPPPSRGPSAREIDAAIAERLFGWSNFGHYPDIGTWGSSPFGRYPVPRYSTDPAAMMEVVEAMRARGLEFTLSSPTPTEARWDATFWDFNPPREYCELAESPARAVALAALAALAAAPPEGTVPRA